MRLAGLGKFCLRPAGIALLVALCVVPRAFAHREIEARIEALTSQLAASPAEASLYFRRGELHRIHGDLRAARADYLRARSLDPGLLRVDLGLSQMFFDAGDFSEALRAVDRLLASHPADREGRALRARTLSKLGRHEEAAREWTRAIEAEPQRRPPPDFYLERAQAFRAAAGGPRAVPASSTALIEEALAGIDEGSRRLGRPIALELYASGLATELGRPRIRAGATIEQAARERVSSSAPSALIQFGSTMRYRANVSDPGIGTGWVAEAFADGAWLQGTYGVGYETSSGARNLLLTTVAAGTSSVYTRARLSVANAARVQSVLLGADYDDGYIAWINGVEVYRSPQMPAGSPAWNTHPALHESSNGQTPNYQPLHDITATAIVALHNGENVLAIGIWNNATTSTDLVLVPELLIDETPTITRGPYLQMGTPTSVVVRWRTSVPTDSRVLYGDAGSLVDPALTTEHIVTIAGLSPDTRYVYSVGTGTQILAGGDDDHAFVTSPPAGTAKATRLWVLGDSGTANDNARAVRNAYEGFTGAIPTDLWLMLGDNAYDTGTDAEYQAAVFEMYPEMLRKAVLWPTYGNHDGYSADSATQTGPYYDLFTLPAAGEAGGMASGTEAYYSFDYGNVHFVCLDAFESNRLIGGAMMTWLEQDLAATAKDWIIAFWHHPPYTKGSHDSDSETDLAEMRENALPILEAYGVDLVLCGHSHSYERSFLIDGHYGLSSTFGPPYVKNGGSGRPQSDGAYQKPQLGPDAHEGTVYAVAGSSGQISGGSLDHPAMYVSLNSLGSMVLDVLGNRLDAAFLDSGGALADHFTMQKGPTLAPVVDFVAAPTTGTAPLDVSFADRSMNGPTAWSWDFNLDGTTDSTVQHPSYVFVAPGLYSVKLQAQNGAGAGERTRATYVCVTSQPSALTVTGVTMGADRQTLTWDASPGSRYDVVKGSLSALLLSGGDFASSLLGCPADDAAVATATDAAVPAGGNGFYYVVRRTDCAGTVGAYDGGEPSQLGSRDAEIASSAGACP